MSLSFRTKMLVHFGLIFTVGVLAVGFIGLYGVPFTGYRGEYGLRQTETYSNLSLLADTKKSELQHLIGERKSDAAIFCESALMRRVVTNVCKHAEIIKGGAKGSAKPSDKLLRSDEYRVLSMHLSTIKNAYFTLYEKISLADAKSGMVIASTDSGDLGHDFSTDPDFMEAMEGIEDEIINLRIDPKSRKPFLSLLHSIKTFNPDEVGDDSIRAVLILYLKPDVFIRMLEAGEGELGKTGEIYLVDGDGELMTPLRRTQADNLVPIPPLGARMQTRAALLAAEGSEGVIATRDYRGVPVLAAFRHLRLNSEVGLGMVVKKDQSEVFSQTRRLLLYGAVSAALLCLAGLGLTYAIATRLSSPIKELSRLAGSVERGDFSVRSVNEGTDEMGVLSNSFNTMVERVQNWHSELEEQVTARTSELVRLNEELEEEIEERNRAEEALRASEGRYRELLETVHQVAVILDLDGNITFCNDFLLNMTGWSRDEVMWRNWFDLFIPDTARDGMKAIFKSAMETLNMPPQYENFIVTKSGALRSIVWDNTLLRSADGSLIGSASLGWDVTEHRSLEEQLRHSQKMEAVGQLAGGMAHDFNNMLTAIIGNCELIKMRSGTDNSIGGFVEQILSVSGKAARLTHDLLAFSRKQILSTSGFDANECVRGVEKLLSRVIGEDIDFRIAMTKARLPILADRDQMEQVLVNLATNARDAMPNGGQLLIETRRIDLDIPSATLHSLEKPGSYAIIQVSDTGCGMDEATRERIFEPFFTTKEVGKGTGLGLAMVFGTIRQHGGYIDVYSELGKGTAFKIYLPLIHDDGIGINEPSPEQIAPGGHETLLVVEDNEDVRRSTALILEKYGYRVIEAADGDEAVARFMENRDSVSLVLLDVIMPKMNGKEVYDALCKLRPDVKALFTSGYASDIISRTLVTEEGLHLLQKPFSVLELLQKIRELLDIS